MVRRAHQPLVEVAGTIIVNLSVAEPAEVTISYQSLQIFVVTEPVEVTTLIGKIPWLHRIVLCEITVFLI